MVRLSIAVMAAASCVALTGIASAADLPRKAYAPPPVSSWTGFYIGGNVGYGWGDFSAAEKPGDAASAVPNAVLPIIGPAATSSDTQGWAGGFQIGYNWQFDPRWVAGVEADINGANIKGNSAVFANLGDTPNRGIFSASQKVDWFGTLRARVGYLLTNDLLVYGTGGLAYGEVKQSANFGVVSGAVGVILNGSSFTCQNPVPGPILNAGPTCFNGSRSRTSPGWTIGGGAEYRLARSWSLKLEYLYVNLGSDSFLIPAVTPTPPFGPSVVSVHFDDVAFNLVRAGLNYRF